MDFMKDEELLEVVANNISNYRKSMGISQEELSEIIGKKSDYIKRLENVEVSPSAEDVYRISIVLDVTMDDLVDPKK